MSSQEESHPQKIFVLSAYPNLSHIETVWNSIAETKEGTLQISILGKLPIYEAYDHESLEKAITATKQKLYDLWDTPFQFGHFDNPDLGMVFIAGHLTPTFLNKVDERELASMPAGLIGIFRELGLNAEDTNTYKTALKHGHCCLIIRGESNALAQIVPLLNVQ